MLNMTVSNTNNTHALLPRHGAGTAMLQSVTAAGHIVEHVSDYHRRHVMAESMLEATENIIYVAYLCFWARHREPC